MHCIPFGNMVNYSADMQTILYFQSPTRTTAPAKYEGVREILEKANVHIQLLEERPTRRRIRELVEFWQPAGAIVETSTTLRDVTRELFGDLPVVFFNPAAGLHRGVFAVYHDQRATGELAARELMTTGLRSFAYVPAPDGTRWSEERGAAFSAALRLNGLGCAVFPAGENDKIRRLKALRKFLAGLTKPSAVFAANDRMAAEVLDAAAMDGLRVPEDLSVLGVDNYEPICEHTKPKLSSIEPDFRRGGNLAALMILAAIRDGSRFRGPRQRSFGPLRVIRRASTRLLRTPDKAVAAALDLISRNACSGLTAERVAATFPCSRRLADTRFRAATGHSILAEIHSVQLERAAELLANPNQDLKSIHDFCGFSHANSLRKFFRRETGMTLSQWRARNLRDARP